MLEDFGDCNFDCLFIKHLHRGRAKHSIVKKQGEAETNFASFRAVILHLEAVLSAEKNFYRGIRSGSSS